MYLLSKGWLVYLHANGPVTERKFRTAKSNLLATRHFAILFG